MISELTIEQRSFWKRLAIQGIVGWIVSTLFILLAFRTGVVGIVLAFSFLIIFSLQGVRRAKYLLVDIKRKGEQFEFRVFKFNKLLTISIPLDELKIEWKPIHSAGKLWQLNFYREDTFQFCQKSFGQWTVPMQQELFKSILTEQGRQPTLDDRLNAEWWP